MNLKEHLNREDRYVQEDRGRHQAGASLHLGKGSVRGEALIVVVVIL